MTTADGYPMYTSSFAGYYLHGSELDNCQQIVAYELISICASSLMLDGIVGELMDVLKFL